MTKPSFAVGDVVNTRFRPERPIKVTEVMYQAALRLRSALIVAAQRRSTLTYQQASDAIDGIFAKQGLGRPLDLVSHDCQGRGEPSLSSLVIGKGTGAAGSAYVGDDAAERERCYQHWINA
jgi:hypothetical protein